ncbi:MAG: hypothetical protein AXA67_01000 [Methylothermaceae bacteria B42]|nr:MAG: hypothetical protein AXA67_01000 [Methylothermaceae bacteria B42]HHJ38220.1 DUF1992 domain-containing protein [Methylothermaceae bacterium]
MLFWERLAEKRIEEAMAKGEFDHLPGAGKPLPEEPDMATVAPSLRMVYRILKNAGYVPEEVQLRREISDIAQLLHDCTEDEIPPSIRSRWLLLTQRLGELREGNLLLQDQYLAKLVRKIESGQAKKDPREAGQK